ncbi:MAG: ABC transporter ATP-binding protein [Bdellovibrionales bacterium]|nr:ABC transporter ATP-binding protein [Bdellovibrionales bacterium]NQZ18147.1 ABC transporter ATP-binding protein [Bdellovibrionales bacterium]
MVIDVQNLNKSFRHPWNLKWIPVLKDVSFSIQEKSIVGFLGANGAGKTTTIKCLLGLLTYQSGVMKVFSKDHTDKSVKQLIGYLPERPYFYNYLTAFEFLKFYGQLSQNLSNRELNLRIEELLELVGLSHAKKMYLNQFSKGMLQRIGMAQSLIHKPKLLILDEPLSGLDPDGRRQLAHIIEKAYEEGATVFFSSHLLDDVDRLCKQLVVIKDGAVRFTGDKSQFTQQSERKFIIKFNKESQLMTESISDSLSLQKRIDELRKADREIVSIDQEKVSLDQAFKKFQSEMHQ